jgi:hypothetical protein
MGTSVSYVDDNLRQVGAIAIAVAHRPDGGVIGIDASPHPNDEERMRAGHTDFSR